MNLLYSNIYFVNDTGPFILPNSLTEGGQPQVGASILTPVVVSCESSPYSLTYDPIVGHLPEMFKVIG